MFGFLGFNLLLVHIDNTTSFLRKQPGEVEKRALFMFQLKVHKKTKQAWCLGVLAVTKLFLPHSPDPSLNFYTKSFQTTTVSNGNITGFSIWTTKCYIGYIFPF